jgi:hypothetical protein
VLFKKVVPYHCLDSIWSHWDMKCKNYLAPTIHTTINQFETMVSFVITTSLGDEHEGLRSSLGGGTLD